MGKGARRHVVVKGQKSTAEATLGAAVTLEGTAERGVAYADSIFDESVTIDGSITDADHYMHLTAAGTDRHQGEAGAGVQLTRSEQKNAPVIKVQDNFTVIDGLEITQFDTEATKHNPAIRVWNCHDVRLSHLLIHDGVLLPGFTTKQAQGIILGGGKDGGGKHRLTNTVIYNLTGCALWLPNGKPVSEVYNVTIARCQAGFVSSTNPCALSQLKATGKLRNVISMDNKLDDFLWSGDSPDYAFLLSSDTSATGNQALTGKTTANVFADVKIGHFQLSPTSVAAETGADLSTLFTDDITGLQRPQGNKWDRGAFERP